MSELILSPHCDGSYQVKCGLVTYPIPEQVADYIKSLKSQIKQSKIDTLNNPPINSFMKAKMMGEHKLLVDGIPCLCEDVEEGEVCAACEGEGSYSEPFLVPWTLQKDIYREMCYFAALSVEKNVSET